VTSEIRVRRTSAADTGRILTAWISGLITVHRHPDGFQERMHTAAVGRGDLPMTFE
jgi:hypothetical protein